MDRPRAGGGPPGTRMLGLSEPSSFPEDVIEAGATSPEILMGLGWNLRQLMDAVPHGLTGDLRTSAGEPGGRPRRGAQVTPSTAPRR